MPPRPLAPLPIEVRIVGAGIGCLVLVPVVASIAWVIASFAPVRTRRD